MGALLTLPCRREIPPHPIGPRGRGGGGMGEGAGMGGNVKGRGLFILGKYVCVGVHVYPLLLHAGKQISPF